MGLFWIFRLGGVPTFGSLGRDAALMPGCRAGLRLMRRFVAADVEMFHSERPVVRRHFLIMLSGDWIGGAFGATRFAEHVVYLLE